MPHQPRLLPVSTPTEPEAVVVVAHGGGSWRGNPMVNPTQLSVLRMVPVARRVARAGGRRVAVFRLLNSTRGWDTRHTPVDDVDWAITQVARQYGDLPVGLVGHSLGGRAVLLAGDDPAVRAVVALNAFVFPSDAPDLRGRRVLFVHGDADRIAVPQRAAVVADRVMRTTDASWCVVPGGKHAMLRHGSTFEQVAAEFVAAALLVGDPPRPRSAVVRRVLSGERHVTA